jgi:hypothetical protein
LYRPGRFLYEGGIGEGEEMEGRGRVSVLDRNMEYEGEFRRNSFSGEGVLLIRGKDVVLDGRW